MNRNNLNINKGFTLVEMLVAIALFSIVITISMGSIFTIIDSNRKAQTLNLVMNNFNFAMDTINRNISSSKPNTISVDSAQNEISFENFDDVSIKYFFEEQSNGIGRIVKEVSGEPIALTSDEVDIESFNVDSTSATPGFQPRVFLLIKGKAQISPRIISEFNIQTTISPRKLNIN